MSNTRIPSPARSQGKLRTPRRYIKRGTRSVGSPARTNGSERLTSIIHMNALSPLPSRRSVLTDSTYIQEPRRKSWWREIDENSGNVLDVLESVTAGNTNNALEDLIEMEVLSQEKHNPLDLPESSDSESITSIVLPRRKLFAQKEMQPKQKFMQLIGNRESLAKLNKNNCGGDKTIIAGTKDLFQNKKQRTKPSFPAALLSVSPNKTTDDVFKETNAGPPETQVRNIFNVRPPTKRKNMFAEFVITESDDEITEIQPKIFEFQKNTAISQQLKKRLTTSSITTDIEMDDWMHLPSSTMVDKQIEEQIAITPQKKPRMSKLSEAKESEVGTNSNVTVDKTKHSNQSLNNVSIDSSKNVESSFRNSQTVSTKNNSYTSNHIVSNECLKDIRKKVSMSQSQFQEDNMSIKKRISKDKTTQAYKGNNETIKETEVSNNTTTTKTMKIQNEPAINENQSIYEELEHEVEDNNFILEYDNDPEDSPIISDKLIEVNNKSKMQNSLASQLEASKLIEENRNVSGYNLVNNKETQNDTVPKQEEYQTQNNKCKEDQIISDDNIINSVEAKNDSAQEDQIVNNCNLINSEEAENDSAQEDQIVNDYNLINSEEAENNSAQEDQIANDYNLINSEEADNDSAQEDQIISDDNIINNVEAKKDSAQEDQIVNDYNLINSEEAENNSAQEDQIANDYNLINNEETKKDSAQEDNVEKTLIDDAVTNEEKEQNNDSDKIEVGEYAHEDDNDIAQELDVDESDVQENQSVDDDFEGHEDDTNESSNNENQYSDDDEEVEQSAENDSEVEKEESEDVNNGTENSNSDAKSPEVILYDKTNRMDTLIGGHSRGRNSKSLMLKSPRIKHSLVTVQDVIRFSDGTKNSSADNSCWDSHRTTRKTIRQTLGKNFSPRKSLRTLVMEKSVKRLTAEIKTQWETPIPQANSTEFLEMSNQDHKVEEDAVAQSAHEISKRTRQATLEVCFQKIKQKNMERRLKIEEAVKHSLQKSTSDNDLFKVPKAPVSWNKRPNKPVQNNSRSKQKKSLISLDDLPPEVLEDLKYKPPKRFKPSNASWITTHLYKFIENKLEAKYDYKARVRAEKLVETIYEFTKNVKRHEVAPAACVHVLKQELARLDVVKTHFEFYNFFHQFMPREIRIKVVPDIVNKIPLPKHGIFSDIIRD